MKDVILIDKSAGWTSFDVVAKIRGMMRADYQRRNQTPTKKQLRVGHAGTLDPFATGLLIVLLGDACKDASAFLKLDKTYEFTAHLGKISTTGDPEGEISFKSSEIPTQTAVEAALKRFRGEIAQIPPQHSAIKINGTRAYQLARAGKKIEMPSRRVRIDHLELVSYEYPLVRGVCDVSSGTYIRSLVEDIGRALGTGAYCSELRRTRIGSYDIQAATLISSPNLINN